MYSLAIIPPFLNGLFTAFLALLISLMTGQELMSAELEFALISLLLTVYLATETSRVRAVQHDRWLANPVVLCSFLSFFLPFCIINLLAILPVDWVMLKEILPPATTSTNKLMFLVLCGAIAMWLGYWTCEADNFARKLKNNKFLSRVLRNEIFPRYDLLLFLVVISLLSKVISIKLGIYGISSDSDQLASTSSVSQFLHLVQGLDKLALIVASLHYFSSERKLRQTRLWFLGLMIYSVGFGFLSGFKSQVIIPLIIVGLCQYLCTSRIPWRIVALVPFALLAAYIIIEPFRAARFDSSSFNSRSAVSIFNTIIQSMSSSDSEISIESDNTQTVLGLAVLSRVSLTEVAAAGVDYADKGVMRDGAPAFLEPLLLSPLYAVVPKFLWSSKQDSTHGRWYYLEVLGGSDISSTSAAMGPVTFLYIAGGWIAVALGFFTLGVIQRILYVVFFMNNRKGGLMVLLVVLSHVVLVESVFYGMLVNILRLVPVALLLQYFVLRSTLSPSVSPLIGGRIPPPSMDV